jgi:cyclin-dependent kinase 9
MSAMSAPESDDDFDYPYCEDSEKYEKITKIGQGTFGEVFKARLRRKEAGSKSGDQLVALKKILMENEKEGFPITALREIKILQLLKHDNVVNLIEICRCKPKNNVSNNSSSGISSNNNSRNNPLTAAAASPIPSPKATFYLVFEFCEHDLAGLISNSNVKFTLPDVKKVMQQLLEGLYFIHSNKILHRDMKAANILITKEGVLKLADFGLARAISVSKQNRYTNRVVTLWYRPPELLLGERNYGPPVDLWGAGCIMAEMWTRSPIMQGTSEQHQLTLISQLCGSITPDVWPGVEKLELFNKMDLKKDLRRRVKERLGPMVKDPFAQDLLDRLLTLDPQKRIDADSALNHDFFWEDPLPGNLGTTLSQFQHSMFEYLAPRRRPTQPPARQTLPQKPLTADGQFHDRVF